jgi:hypothetical protein
MGANSTSYYQKSLKRIVTATSDVPLSLAEALWRDPTAVMADGARLQARSQRSTVRVAWENQSFVMKHYGVKTRIAFLKQLVRPPRAWVTWQAGVRLANMGINTPRPAAMVENFLWPFRGDSYLLYPYVQGQTLQNWLNSADANPSDLGWAIRQQFIEIWNRLVNHRVSLADPHLDNFVLDEAGKLWVIDLDNTKFHLHRRLAIRKHAHCWRQLHRSARRIGPLAQRFVDQLQSELHRNAPAHAA